MMVDAQQNQTQQPTPQTFVYLMTNPDGSFRTDRIIISKSQSYPKIFTFKVIGSELVNSFIPIFDLDYSKSVEPEKVSQIIGAVSIFKINPDLYQKIVSNSDLSDMNVVLDSSKTLYGIIKRFLLTNPENLANTLNEVVAYVDTYVKAQLAKYEVSDDQFITDINTAMFLMLSGKQKLYQSGVVDFIKGQANNLIPPSQLPQQIKEPQKKGFFSFFTKNKDGKVKQAQPPKTNKKATKDKDDLEFEKEMSKLDKEIGKPEKPSLFRAIWQKWIEESWESPETHQRRVEQKKKEMEDKLEIEREKLELIEKKQALKEKMKKKNTANSSQNTDTQQTQSSNTDEED